MRRSSRRTIWRWPRRLGCSERGTHADLHPLRLSRVVPRLRGRGHDGWRPDLPGVRRGLPLPRCGGTGQADEEPDLDDDDPSEAEHDDWDARAADCGAEMRRI